MIEKLLEMLAPDCCINCNKEGVCLCKECEKDCLVIKKPSCVLCNSLTSNGQICTRCKSKTKLSGVSVSYRYETEAKQLVRLLKYHQKRSVARFFGPRLVTPKVTFDLVSFVPSDGKSQRARGYNQAELIAKAYSKTHSLRLTKTLLRQKHTRQVDLSRKQRFEAIQGNFRVLPNVVQGRTILLVDDVVTTGATLSECARTLKGAGAKRVWGMVVAKK